MKNTLSNSLKSKSPIEDCTLMLAEVDSMLKIITTKPEKNSLRTLEKRQVSSEFKIAIKTLSNRLLTQRTPTKYAYDTLRLKFTPNTPLGPGQYMTEKAKTPVMLRKILTLKDFEKTARVKNVEPIIKMIKANYSPAEHNDKVRKLLEKRKEMAMINDIRKRDRFKTHMRIVKEGVKKEYISEVLRMFFYIYFAYSFNFLVKRSIRTRIEIKARSKLMLSLLYYVIRAIVIFKKTLKRIRKKVANKNIHMITRPLLRFALNKRQLFRSSLVKHIKYILQSNLLTLLLYRFLTYIKTIQSSYTTYRRLKVFRIQALYLQSSSSKISSLDFWVTLSINSKAKLLDKFLINRCYAYSKEKCKYLNDTKAVNTKFTRNLNFWASDAISSGMGRNFVISLPPPPKFVLFQKSADLIGFIKSCETKSKSLRNSKGFKKKKNISHNIIK